MSEPDLQSSPHRLGIYGGTFDPIHYGHLRCAWEVVEALNLDQLLMIPAGSPALRNRPGAAPEARLEMLKRALSLPQGRASRILVDDREIRRQGTSYTYDTLAALRQAHPTSCLWMVVGEDAFTRFDRWHRWDEILNLTNLVIVPRPGFSGTRNDAVSDLVQSHRVDLPVPESRNGMLVELRITPLDISATGIRELVEAGREPVYLTPATVVEFITAQSLYKKGVQ